METLVVGTIPERFNRVYTARDRVDPSTTYKVNLARLTCTCRDFTDRQINFPPGDARRVCAHLYNKLYQTKAERAFDPLVQMFIRYGREILTYRLVEDALGRFIMGFPFGARYLRASRFVRDQTLLATYDLKEKEWSSGGTPLSKVQATAVMERMRVAYPEAFR